MSLASPSKTLAVERVHIPPRDSASTTPARVSRPDDRRELQAERVEQSFLRAPRLSPSTRPFEITDPGGNALDDRTRRVMTHRLGHDFSKVRVFADSSAASSTRALDAHAYSAGDDVVFGDRLYSPKTRPGQALLAHELTHVAQQRSAPLPVVMRKGRTVGGFFANLFQFWDYSKETLEEYLATLSRSNEIVGDDDSDDMARQVAAEWKADRSAHALTPRVRVLLIREMLDGAVLRSDQEGILTLLEGSSNSELKEMIGPAPGQITFAEIHEHFGVLKARLELFNQEVLGKLGQIKEPPPDGKPLLEMLEEREAQTGLRVEQVSIAFDLSPGALYKSFLADFVVPGRGSRVTITITREALRISISPGILIDIIGPVNATLGYVTFRFQGSKAELGMDTLRETANRKVHEYIQDLLAGTRFAAPDYNFSRDPHLISEIRDPSVIGDINRVKYNLQKSTAGERGKEEEGGLKEQALQQIHSAGAELFVVHTQGVRFPAEEEGWGIKVPAATKFWLTVETKGRGAELANKEVELARVGVRSSGVFVVRGKEEILQIGGFDMLPGLEFKLHGMSALKDLKEVLKEEYPGDLPSTAAKAMSAYDAFRDFINLITGGSGPKSDVALSLATWLGQREMQSKGMYFVRLYWGTLRDYTGMTDAQLSKFFGVKPPGVF